MKTGIGIILFAIFLFLSGIHFYWAFGGKWGKDIATPVNLKNEKIFTPGFISTLFVGFALLSFGLMNLSKTKLLKFNAPEIIDNYLLWFIAFVFILRAIGEFKYVGFFKKIKHSKFGQADTQIYSPLCFLIGVLEIILQLSR
jgi:Protein of unknown function (DUF3995)